MQRYLGRLACPLLLVAWLTTSAAAESLSLDFSSQVTVKGKASETRTHLVHVLIGPSTTLVEDRDDRTLYDFAGGRVYDLRSSKSDSLYANVGGRQAEMANRFMLGGALGAANITEPSFDPVMIEQLFSMMPPSGVGSAARPELAEPDGAASVRATYKDKALLTASAAGFAVDPERSRLYVRFVRYYLSGHPEALARLTATHRVPDTLSVYQVNPGEERTTTLTLTKHELVAQDPTVPAGFQETYADQPLEQRLKAAAALPANPPDLGLNDVTELIKSKQYLGAVLACFENFLCLGGGLSPAMTENRALFMADPSASKLFANLQAADPAGLTHSLGELKSLEPNAGTRLFVLQVFEAGLTMQQGPSSRDQGRDLYLKALETQPRLAGAWKDLGDYYFTSYESARGWRCWDTARRLAPHHRMLEQINELESHLKSEYPDFF